MEVSPVSSVSRGVLDIYAEGARQEMEQVEKLAKVNLELKMKADQMALATAALLDFYA